MMTPPRVHRTLQQLQQTYDQWPPFLNEVIALVVRPTREERLQPLHVEVHPEHGVIGDRWGVQEASDAPVSLIEHRVAHALALGHDMHLAGDNLVVDWPLGDDETPVGTRLVIGSTLLEITAEPHHGCAKFIRRYGLDAQRWVNQTTGLRGRYARVLKGGIIRIGDSIERG